MTEERYERTDDAVEAIAPASEIARLTGRSSYKIKRATGQFELTPRHRLLAQYMIYGTSHPRAKRLGLPLNIALSLEQSAAVLDLRRRNCREVTLLPEFQKLLLSLTAALRNGEHGRSVSTIVEIRDEPGENSAADRKVRLDAARALIGEDGKNLSVNVNIDHRQINLRPGYVIKPFTRSDPSMTDVKPVVRIPASPSFDFPGHAPEPKPPEPIFTPRKPW